MSEKFKNHAYATSVFILLVVLFVSMMAFPAVSIVICIIILCVASAALLYGVYIGIFSIVEKVREEHARERAWAKRRAELQSGD